LSISGRPTTPRPFEAELLSCGCAENFRDGRRCHGNPVGGALSFQSFLGSLLDQNIDQRQSLCLVVGFRQQLLIAIEIKFRVLPTHLTPPRTRSSSKSVP